MKTGWQVKKKMEQDEIQEVWVCKDFENQNKEL